MIDNTDYLRVTHFLTEKQEGATFDDLIRSLVTLLRLWHERKSHLSYWGDDDHVNDEFLEALRPWINSLLDVLSTRYSDRFTTDFLSEVWDFSEL